MTTPGSAADQHGLSNGPAEQTTPDPHDRSALADALALVLSHIRAVIGTLAADAYRAPSGRAFMGASVGAHVRHILDHVAAVVDHGPDGTIDYDSRIRGTPVERDPAAAASEIDRLADALRTAAPRPDAPVEVRVMPRADAEAVRLASSIEREIAFALSHTIHHCASIRGILHTLDIESPDDFGYAPATLAQKEAQRKA